jgi:DNA processing protein
MTTQLSDAPGALPDEAYAAALAGLDLMTVVRLRSLLRHHAPHEAWQVVLGEQRAAPPIAAAVAQAGVGDAWRASARRRSPAAVWQRCLDERIAVSVLGTSAYPALLAQDFQAPAVLFHRGDLGVLDRRRVGVVGTRNATASGRSTAATFGRLLAEADVTVVSGLARGIDGAAHRGVTSHPEGRPVAVVASGLDVVYPKEHDRLWSQVAETGLLLSESPPGTPPEAYRFPLRNRILAALSEVLLVVESRASGGSLITVEAARTRQVTVLVVPGSAANRSSEGTNALARDGCGIALDVDDVLVALGLDTRRAGALPFDPRPQPTGLESELIELIGADAVELDTLVAATSRPLGDVALALGRLEASGWLQQTCGWFERVDSPVAWV